VPPLAVLKITREMSAAKRRVALHSMLAALAMTLLKLAAGLLSGSLGVLSDAAHSGSTWSGRRSRFFSVQVSDKPADATHTYGHAKFENLSAFVEAGLMAISCAWIIWEAMQRIVRHDAVVHHSLWPVLVLLTSIAVDWWRSRKLYAVAREFNSTALAADAFHFASDIWSTLAVLAASA
jgi:cation diffusion facilitator family transporter